MAALPYMQLYVADYLADTMHLSTEEHGAYLLLIFNYWQTGKPIPVSRLAGIARLSNERWTAVERSLNEFFNERDGVWIHERIERDLAGVHEAQQQRSAAGKASAQARKDRANAWNEGLGNGRSTVVELALSTRSTNKDTDKDQKLTPLSPPLRKKSAHSRDPASHDPRPGAVAPPKRKARLPDPFHLTGQMRQWAAERVPAVDLSLETERFVNYYRGHGKTMADWPATWRNWVLKAQGDANRHATGPARGPPTPSPDFDDTTWAAEDIL